jgi:hypothetical protein
VGDYVSRSNTNVIVELVSKLQVVEEWRFKSNEGCLLDEKCFAVLLDCIMGDEVFNDEVFNDSSLPQSTFLSLSVDTFKWAVLQGTVRITCQCQDTMIVIGSFVNAEEAT